MRTKKEQFVSQLIADVQTTEQSRPMVTEGVTRGVVRLLFGMGFSPLLEFKLKSGRRADVAGLDRKGRFLFAEVKSSVADYRADEKWQDYLPYCDWFYFAVPPQFPIEILPNDTGIIIADGHDGVIARPAPEFAMNGNRRRVQTIGFARKAAARLSRSASAQA